jgi:hypothetical protein
MARIRPTAAVAAKRRDSSAQGNALGPRYIIMILALKGRDPSVNSDPSHPVRVPPDDGNADPGRCPGLMSVTPSGSVIASKTAGEKKAGRSLNLETFPMGRQVNFYMMPADLADLEAQLKARNDIVFLAVRMSSPQPREENSLRPLPGDFGMRYLARRPDLGKLTIHPVPEQGDYAISAPFSPVVEFSRSRLSDETGRLAPGRMYVTTSAWDGTGYVKATPDFLKWADTLFNAIKRSKDYSAMKDPGSRGFYVSRRAAAWRDQGGILGY